ncbi:nucleoside phosphorylase [Roseococcus sp. DSY-14]|uniref:phosphorylase family protein n=1 Tax=Roseococcus sp. DSY-14 TaxID=3369650 RepID=UPI00387B1ABF
MAPLPPGTLIFCGLLAEARLWPAGTPVLAVGGRPRAPDGPRPSAILSFGLCGGLDPALPPGTLLSAAAIPGHGGVDAAWAAALAARTGARPAVLAHSPAAVATPVAKAALRAATGAAAVDMESGFAADLAAAWGIPFAALRAVGDAAADAVPASAMQGLNADGSAAPGRVALALLRRPGDLPGLLRVAWSSRAGMRALKLAASALHA